MRRAPGWRIVNRGKIVYDKRVDSAVRSVAERGLSAHFLWKGARCVFGYVTPDKGEMKVREYECYRAVYCGLCMQLKADYGFVSRMLLNYDLVTVALLADGLSGQQGSPCMKRCMANPLRRRCMHAGTDGLRLAAAALVQLSWYKLADDLADEPFARRAASAALRLLLRRAHKKAAAAQPELDKLLAEQTVCQQRLEQASCANPDEAAEPTGRMTAAILKRCAVQPEQEHILERMGLFLGKILYWLDAAEDFEKDREKGRYNVFLHMGLDRTAAIEQAALQCRLAAGEVARCYNLLELQLNRPILDNIIFLGLPAGIRRAGQPIKHKKHAAPV